MSEGTAVQNPMLRCADAICQCSCALREALVMKGVGVVEPVAG